MLNLLAEVDPIKGLAEHWPWMLVVIAVGKWIASIMDRVATRHITFIDALDKRDQDGLVHQANTSIALGAISEKLSESRSKLSTIEDVVAKNQCQAVRQAIPHGA